MPKIVDHEQVRADIVARAVQLFAEQGFGGLGIRGLAKAVGMAKSSIYYYYQTKEALIDAVIEAVVTPDLLSLEAEVQGAGSLDKRLDRAASWIAKNEERFAVQIRILSEAAREEKWNDDGRVTQPYVKGLSSVLGLNTGAARSFYLHILGVVLQRMVDGKRTSLKRELSTFNDLLVKSKSSVETKVKALPAAAKSTTQAAPAAEAAPKTAKKTSRKAAKKTSRKAAKKTRSKTASATAARKKSATKKSATKKAATKKAATKKAATKKAATKKAATKKAAKKKTTRAAKTSTRKAATASASKTRTKAKKKASKRRSKK
ncbi:TetR/AcrR family transcriptional regulator [Haliangium ochraceum]|uniref:Transcriptional regulator, TetR family n=1 Tax=Haliangium ochraceum (strain DSM 14365 / JCM 11303 / SMP-2) TaxID=502025 RepID=D0LU97_HALO1|nr:TetR/AcrR family transcriptional regulator [Haliangium ochraceum]ACY17461.1 transcriptional regulator, TetR family [Haliangium ochraceum DSM 14365]